MNILVLAFDGLSNGTLSPYGCTWADSPAFNRLAAESLVLDNFYADRLQLSDIYKALWERETLGNPESDTPCIMTLAQEAAENDFRPCLFSDEIPILEHAAAEGFQTIESVETQDADSDFGKIQLDDSIANNLESTTLFREFVALTNLIAEVGLDSSSNQTDKPFFLWSHLGSLGNRWDAPEPYRSRYVEEGDLPALKSAITPCQSLIPQPDGTYDPDQKLQLSQTYAGQLSVLDVCLEALLDYLDDSGLSHNTALVLLSVRGIGLGEHGRVGLADPTFHSEYSRLSGWIKLPRPGWGLRRAKSIVTFSDIHTILRSLILAPSTDSPVLPDWLEKLGRSARDRIIGQAEERQLIQTAAWRYLYESDNPSAGKLFAIPDDRWEINDIAEICPEIIEKLLEQKEQEKLDDALVSIWR